ncbi:MAG: S41 family peptidase [bacterium]|nr:S41 family peptidase [bacterium]
MRNLSKRYIFMVLFIVVFGMVSFTGTTTKMYDELKLFSEGLERIQSNYVEEVDPKKLIYGALSGMARSLDPYSQFMEPDMYNETKVETEGEFGGLGLRIEIKDEILTVVAPIEGTPAYKQGVLPGDRITKIDGKETKGLSLLESVKRLRGAKGTKVSITIYREGAKDLLEFTIVRDMIKIESVKYKMLNEKLGYIKINEFTEKTALDLDKALTALEKQNAEKLILDLRNNPGGLLNTCIEVCKQFIGDNKLLLSIRGRDTKMNQQFIADKDAKHKKWPMVILVNKGSASASEILSGVVQDYKRGRILGAKTFGKGSVQTVMPMSDGSGLRLTTAKYYLPSGRSIHEIGVTPDIIVEIPREDEVKLMMQHEGIPLKAGEKPVKDLILEKAIELLQPVKDPNTAKKGK